jgi:hypothetical protein
MSSDVCMLFKLSNNLFLLKIFVTIHYCLPILKIYGAANQNPFKEMAS